ncbi:MAG TPA: hypothetical protein VNK82_12145 [Terriglobales bacterium]|nr:hypothetical protein [Terriglobales bacterium]
MSKAITVREWDAESFHARVLALEKQGYVARRETYSIRAEMHPETGWIVHLHSMEMVKEEEETRS